MIHFNDSERPFKEGDCGPKYLGSDSHSEWGVLVLKPGQGSRLYGRHFHKVVAETFYILEGSVHFWIEGKEFEGRVGDIVTVEPHEKHWLENRGDGDFRAVFIKVPFDPTDRHPF